MAEPDAATAALIAKLLAEQDDPYGARGRDSLVGQSLRTAPRRALARVCRSCAAARTGLCSQPLPSPPLSGLSLVARAQSASRFPLPEIT